VAEISLSSSVNLIVATLDLAEVQLVTQAIRTADLTTAAQIGGRLGVTVGPAATFERSAVLHDGCCIEAHHAVYTANAVRPCFAPQREVKARCEPFADQDSAPTVTVHAPPSPIQPPWETLPWPVTNPSSSSKVIKLIMRQSDNRFSGTILDCFI
jgi:hypothetical protein